MKRNRKFFTTILLVFVVALLFNPKIVSADATYKIAEGNVNISEAGNYIIEGDGNETSNIIVISYTGTEDINIELKNVNIKTTSGSPLKIPDNHKGNVTVILTDLNILDARSSGSNAGIEKNSDSESGTLTIKGDGTLNVYGGHDSAAIGSKNSGRTANITIESGTINAYGKEGGAAIGGGNKYSAGGGVAKNIQIKGGTIYAEAQRDAPGIGGGSVGAVDGITISGGHIIAKGGDNAPGIGAGVDSSYAKNISITGGTVIAIGGDNSYGIGAGLSPANNISLTGGVLITDAGESGKAEQNLTHSGGIYIPKKSPGNSKVKGNVTLEEDLILPEDVNLEVENGATLTISEGKTLTAEPRATLIVKGTINNSGKVHIKEGAGFEGAENVNGGILQNDNVLNPDSFSVLLIANPKNGGTVVTQEEGPYSSGDTVKVIATPKAGYEFVNWTENGKVVSNSSTYSFNIENNRNLIANFKEVVPTTELEVKLTVIPENGGTVVTQEEGPYSSGDTVKVIATPKAGYEFVNWTEDGKVVSNSSTYSFNIENNRNLIANFKEVVPTTELEVKLTVIPENGGTVIGSGTYDSDSKVTVKAIPNNGYKFVKWLDNETLISTDPTFEFTINRDLELVAVFEKIEENLNL